MRLILQYAFAVIALTIYGGQVWPFLETLPSVTLGVIILTSFLIPLAIRVPAERRFVRGASVVFQPKRA